MNKSEKIIKKIEEIEVHTVNVQPEHASKVDKYLKDKKIKHHKVKKENHLGYGYFSYGFRPEFFGGFNHACPNVTCDPNTMGASSGGYTGDATGGDVSVT